MPNYAPRVSLSFNDMSGVIRMWSNSCDKMVVYEHEADEDVKTTHVHMIMINCKYKSQDTLCNQFRKLIDIDLKGNSLWSWEHKDFKNPDEDFITYMSKGCLEPVFIKNMTNGDIEKYKSRWKNYEKKVAVPIGQIVEARVTQKTKWELLNIMNHEIQLYQQQHPNHMITKEIRNRIIVQVLKEEKQVIGLYKVQEFSYAFSLHFDTEVFLDALNNSMKC